MSQAVRIPTLDEYETLLKRHDWTYFMAQGNAYFAGKKSRGEIEYATGLIQTGPDAEAAAVLYAEYAKQAEIVW